MTEIEFFVGTLLGNSELPAGAHALLWTLPNKRSQFFRSPLALAATAARLTDAHDVYIGVGLRSRDHGASSRGGANDVIGLVGLWADIDIVDPTHKKANLPPDEDAARALLDELPLAPTLLVHSGHGLQAWWAFSEPYLFDSAEERGRVAGIARGWHERLKAAAKAHGWDVDSVWDISRVLRLPGTVNRKGVPVPVCLLEAGGPVYGGPGDFANHIARSPLPERTAPAPAVADTTLDGAAEPPAGKFSALIENDKKFRGSWRRERRDFQDQSASAYDLSLATIAARAGWQDREITNLLIASRREHGDDLKRPDYYQRTIQRARSGLSERDLVQTADVIEVSDQDTAKQIAFLRRELDAPLTGIIRRSAGEGRMTYVLRLEGDQEVPLGKIEEVERFKQTRARISDVTKTFMASIPPARWTEIVRLMVKLSEDDTFVDASPVIEVWEWLRRYVGEKAPASDGDWHTAYRECDPFFRGGDVFIHVQQLRKYLGISDNLNIDTSDLRLKLRTAGFHPDRMVEKVDDVTYTRYYWRAPISGLEG